MVWVSSSATSPPLTIRRDGIAKQQFLRRGHGLQADNATRHLQSDDRCAPSAPAASHQPEQRRRRRYDGRTCTRRPGRPVTPRALTQCRRTVLEFACRSGSFTAGNKRASDPERTYVRCSRTTPTIWGDIATSRRWPFLGGPTSGSPWTQLTARRADRGIEDFLLRWW